MYINLKDRHIDNSYYRVNAREAARLAREGPNGKLPRPGFEIRVKVNGAPVWLCRTVVWGKTVWAVHGGTFEIPLGE